MAVTAWIKANRVHRVNSIRYKQKIICGWMNWCESMMNLFIIKSVIQAKSECLQHPVTRFVSVTAKFNKVWLLNRCLLACAIIFPLTLKVRLWPGDRISYIVCIGTRNEQAQDKQVNTPGCTLSQYSIWVKNSMLCDEIDALLCDIIIWLFMEYI